MAATHQGMTTGRTKPLSIVREGDGDPRHGRLSTYNNHECRCGLCRAAMREYGRDLRQRRRAARRAG